MRFNTGRLFTSRAWRVTRGGNSARAVLPFTYNLTLNLRNDRLSSPSLCPGVGLKCAFPMKFDAIPIPRRFRSRHANISPVLGSGEATWKKERRIKDQLPLSQSPPARRCAPSAPRGTIKSRSTIPPRT